MGAPTPSSLAPTTNQRLCALEQTLLGDGVTLQGEPPFERLNWLEAQLGGTSGTVLQRLEALEYLAMELGLI